MDLDKSWVVSIEEKMKRARLQCLPAKLCPIFMVPDNLREQDANAYEPQIVSIGPLHKGKKNVIYMEQIKWGYLERFLSRKAGADLGFYLKMIKEEKLHARSFYPHFCMSDNEFVETMLLDGCFIIEHILTLIPLAAPQEGINDSLCPAPWMLPLIQLDMIKIENQIPYFILRILFDSIHRNVRESDTHCSLEGLVLNMFKGFLTLNFTLDYDIKKVKHIVHLLQHCGRPSEQDTSLKQRFYNPLKYHRILDPVMQMKKIARVKKVVEFIPSATELMEGGINFKKNENSLQVNFRRGDLKVPPIGLYDQTSCILRNLIAFEQCYPEVGNHVSCFAQFMDSLVNTADDVLLLEREKIIVNRLGSQEDAASLFNNLCTHIMVDHESCYLAGLFNNVHEYSNSKLPRWRAKLFRDYFNSPWSFISLLAAVALLVLTTIQTYYTAISYVQKP